LVALLVLGLLGWLGGALDLVGDHRLLDLVLLVGGSLLIACSGYPLLASRPSGELVHGLSESGWFCGTFGIGLASIGLAVSPITGWLWPGTLFAAGGVLLLAWTPQAFGRTARLEK
jgi:hypothetical protein